MAASALLTGDAKVLTSLHVRLLEILGQAGEDYGLSDLRLEGGTALSAYHLHHRQSEDLDLFAGAAMDARDFRSFVAERVEGQALSVVREGPASLGFAELFVSASAGSVPAGDRHTVRVQFCRASPFRLEAPQRAREGIRVASYRDLCAGKLHALCDRFEPRDFLDLHCILHRPLDAGSPEKTEMQRRFRDLLADLERSDPGLNEARVGEALARGLDRPIVSDFPLALLIPIAEEDVHATIVLALDECARIAAERMQ